MFKLKTNGIGHIFSKLNIAEQAEIRKYIGQEVTRMIVKNQGELEKAATEKEKYLTELNDKTWQRIETFLHMSMREHKISEERIDMWCWVLFILLLGLLYGLISIKMSINLIIFRIYQMEEKIKNLKF